MWLEKIMNILFLIYSDVRDRKIDNIKYGQMFW
jgi:hypothetical protein